VDDNPETVRERLRVDREQHGVPGMGLERSQAVAARVPPRARPRERRGRARGHRGRRTHALVRSV